MRSLRIVRLAVVAALVLLTGACERAPELTAAEAIAKVESHAEWMTDANACPSVFMQRPEAVNLSRMSYCEEGQLGACLHSCETGIASACYWLAQDLQPNDADQHAVNALFQRSCKLGVASGCTNRAAYDVRFHADDRQRRGCGAKTFERACKLGDPWGCSMYGMDYLQGFVPDGSREKTLAALAHSCDLGDDDPACVNGRAIRERVIASGGGDR